MATALIHFAQGAHTDTAGKAVLGVAGDFSAITITNGSNTGVVSWKIFLLDAPPDSTTFPAAGQPQILAQATNNTPTTVFTPDVAGTYRVMLEVTDGVGSVDRDIRCFGIPDARGFVRPPFQQGPEPLPLALPGIITLDPRPTKPDEQNYATNVRGWAGNGSVGQLDAFLRQYDDLPQKVVATTPYTALGTDPPLHLVDIPTIAGPATFNLPAAPRTGFVSRIGVLGGYRSPVTVQASGGGTIGSGAPLKVYGDTGVALVHKGSNNWALLSTPGDSENADRANVKLEFGAAGDGTTNDTTAINAALASGKSAVYFPPGVYRVDGTVTGSANNQTVTFAPGAALQITPGSGTVTFSGTAMHIVGMVAAIVSGSSATFNAITIAGVDAIVDGLKFSVLNADVANATLIRVIEDRAHIRDVLIISDGRSFWRGLHLERTVSQPDTGTECGYCVVNGVIFELGDSGVTKTFDALIHWRALSSELHNVYFFAGGRTCPNTCIVVNGHRNSIYNPRILSFGATYGIRTIDLTAEFLHIFGGSIQGRNTGTFVAGSEGISCGHFCGHLKLYGTAISGWETGVVFHGSHDTPGFFGAVIANNGTYAVTIDCQIGPDVWQVSGFTMEGCYTEGANGFQNSFMYLKSGALFACGVTGGYFGFVNRWVYVDPAFQGNNIVFNGARLAGGVSSFVTEPGQFSTFYFVNCEIDGGGGLGTGTYAAKAMNYMDPTLTSLTIGSGGNKVTRMVSDVYTANFGTVSANSSLDLDFTYAGVSPTFSEVTATIGHSLGIKAGIIYTWWIDTFDHIGGRATNITGADIASVSGGVRFTVTTHT